MSDLFKTNENEFYIELKQERYYFPGDHVAGDIVLDLKKPTKTNSIKISLEGYAEIGGKMISIYSKSIHVAEPPEGEKSHLLEARTHRFPFELEIPQPSEKKLPSTLKIPKLLKVKYKITAVHNRPYMIVEKLCSTATEIVTILEKINVESDHFKGEYSVSTELALTGESKKVKVIATLGKRAALKGDTIPITVTIHHTGATAKKKGIQVQLLRYVYYGKNRNEVFGPKVLSETSTDIDISGLNFTKSFQLKLTTPKTSLCPTVDKSCDVFKIEYNIRVKINLNEENRFRTDRANDIVSFNMPIIIGTLPQYDFNIDDDDEEEEELLAQKTDDSSEYSQVFEKMNELDIGSAPITPITPISLEAESNPLATQFHKPNEYIDDDQPTKPNEYTEDRSQRDIKPLPKLQEEEYSILGSPLVPSPTRNTFRNVPENMPSVHHRVTIISPLLEQSVENPSTKFEIQQGLPLQRHMPSLEIKSFGTRKRISSVPPPVPSPVPSPVPPPVSFPLAPPPLPARRLTSSTSLQNKPLPRPIPPPLPSRPVSYSSTPVIPTMNHLQYNAPLIHMPLPSSSSQPSLPIHSPPPPPSIMYSQQAYDPSHYHPLQPTFPYYNHPSSTHQTYSPHANHSSYGNNHDPINNWAHSFYN